MKSRSAAGGFGSIAAEEIEARSLYETHYCARGEMENCIKEQQLDLFADRPSTHALRSNQLRLWFSSITYVLMHSLRRLGWAGTCWEHAQCDTIRLKLLKIGAAVRVSVRRVWIALSESYPFRQVLQQVLVDLRAWPLTPG